MSFHLTDSFLKGSEYFQVDYSLGSFFGVLFITVFLGFTLLFFFSVFYTNKYSNNI
tara:strand:+ start:437 stop:604 length:168 start_codon:yes stop_codon:yes gene_type:complete